MKHVLTAFLFLVSFQAFGSERFVSPKDFVEKYVAQEKDKYQITLSESNSRNVVGAIYPRVQDTNKSGIIFIMKKNREGTYSLEAQAPQHGVLDHRGRTSIEIIEIQDQRHFYIQYNSSSACGEHSFIYRFTKIVDSWRVSGYDYTDSQCESKDSVGPSEKISVNFLTGVSVVQAIQNRKKSTKKITQTNYPPFPFEKFIPFDLQYEGPTK